MNKAEALELVGQPVSAWTAANGVYAGTLVEVLPTRPWRAKVVVTGVLSVAQHFELGGVGRRGFRPGETLEVGHSSVKGNPPVGTDYLSALHVTIEKHRGWLANEPSNPLAWVHVGSIAALTRVIAAEERRLAGEPWLIGPAPTSGA